MRRVALLVGGLALPALPVALAAPAYAATNTICVGAFVGTCDDTADTVQEAIAAAGNDGTDTVIGIGPGTYTDGPYQFNGAPGDTLEVRGSPALDTILTLPASTNNQTYVTLAGATLKDMQVLMENDDSANDTGVVAYDGSGIEVVIIDGAGTVGAGGVIAVGTTVTGSLINMGNQFSLAFYSGPAGGNSLSGTSLVGSTAFVNATSQTSPDVLSAMTIVAKDAGVNVASGTVSIDNSLIRIGNDNGVGLAASSGNAITTPKTLNADHVTVVGGGPGSVGVLARSTIATVLQTSTVNLTNSIVRGPEVSLAVRASNNGSQGGPSVANVNATYTAYEDTDVTGVNPTTGTGSVVLGVGTTTADPQFGSPGTGDFHPLLGSPAIDAGNPAAGGPTTDLENLKRVTDGNADGIDRRDLGAYELADSVAPDTAITSGPSGPTNDEFPDFTFTSDPGATFECQVGAAPYALCTSPLSLAGLPIGFYTVRVRATDTSGNVDPTPATRSFTVDTISPSTKITRKPPKQLRQKKAKFAFTSNDPTVTFRCGLDKIKKLRPCASPFRIKVTPGRHVFFVQAVDPAGNTDATPAQYGFVRVKPPTR